VPDVTRSSNRYVLQYTTVNITVELAPNPAPGAGTYPSMERLVAELQGGAARAGIDDSPLVMEEPKT